MMCAGPSTPPTVMTFCTRSRPASPALRPLCGFAARGRSRAADDREEHERDRHGGKRTEGHALYAAAFSSHRHRVKGACRRRSAIQCRVVR
jgi:hypothetical protein